LADDEGREKRPRDERERRGDRPKSRLDRREAKDRLQVLSDEQQRAEVDEEADGVGGERGVELPRGEEPQLEQGVLKPALARDERPAEPEAGGDRADRGRVEAVSGPTANVRWRSFVKIAKIRDSVEGASVAPAMPRSAREAISIATLDEAAAITDATAKAAEPIMSRRRRPIRSPKVPIVIRKPAVIKP